MSMLKMVFYIILSSILVDNYVLTKFLGICPFLGVSKKVDQATGMGIAVTFVMVLATAVTWPLYHYLLAPLELQFLEPLPPLDLARQSHQ